MSEPNDTAQEGFDQLKRNLEVRYPEDSDLSLDEFLNVESLLALAVRVCGPGADPRKADRLLSNYQHDGHDADGCGEQVEDQRFEKHHRVFFPSRAARAEPPGYR